jgi:malonyl CoA-acyl carrier protein transacylase
MITEGASQLVEVGPGRVLTGLNRKINRKIRAICVNSKAAIAEAIP